MINNNNTNNNNNNNNNTNDIYIYIIQILRATCGLSRALRGRDPQVGD